MKPISNTGKKISKALSCIAFFSCIFFSGTLQSQLVNSSWRATGLLSEQMAGTFSIDSLTMEFLPSDVFNFKYRSFGQPAQEPGLWWQISPVQFRFTISQDQAFGSLCPDDTFLVTYNIVSGTLTMLMMEEGCSVINSAFQNSIWINTDIATGINEVNNSTRLYLFPNPATDIINVQLATNNVTDQVSYQVFNSQGIKVRDQKRIVVNNNSAAIETRNLKPGIYSVVFLLNNGESRISQKFIIK